MVDKEVAEEASRLLSGIFIFQRSLDSSKREAVSKSSHRSGRRGHRESRSSKQLRTVLLSLGILSLTLAVVLGVIGRRSGNAFLQRMAIAYVVLSLLFLCIREALNWLKQRRKRAVRRRREARSSQAEGGSAV